MFVINPNQSWSSLADKLGLTVVPFFFNISESRWGFWEGASYLIGEIPIKDNLYPMLEERIVWIEHYTINWESNKYWECRMILDCQIQGKLKQLYLPLSVSRRENNGFEATLKIFKIKNHKLSYLQSFDLTKMVKKDTSYVQNVFCNITENVEIDLGDTIWIEIILNNLNGPHTASCILNFENSRGRSDSTRRIPYFVFGQ